MPSVIAKFRCQEKKVLQYSDDEKTRESIVILKAVLGPGNEQWAKWTPTGSIQMTITNSEALDAFKLGQSYLVTFEVCS